MFDLEDPPHQSDLSLPCPGCGVKWDINDDGSAALLHADGCAFLAAQDEEARLADLADAGVYVVDGIGLRIRVELTLKEDFLSDILITAFDGGYGGCWYWADTPRDDTSNYVIDGADLDAIWRSVRITEQGGPNDDDNPGPFIVDHAVLAKGIARIMSGEAGLSVDEVHGAVIESDAGQIDSDLADCIVQEGLFGKQVYG